MNNAYTLKRSGNLTKRAVLALVSSTFGIVLILFGFDIAKSAEPIPPVLPQITNPTVINMKQAGAKGDGISDDSAIIQSIINNAPNNTKFYFPQGTYRLHNIEAWNRSKLIFEGDGNNTILQWRGVPVNCPALVCDYTAMMTFTGVSDLIIQNIALDNKAIKSFGGVRFYEMKRVLIQNTRFYDSSPAGFSFQHGDRYSYVFGQSYVTSEDITILNNTFEDLQLEVDHSRRVRIEGNTSLRSPSTGALGTWAVASNAIAEDYFVTNNTIVDPNNFAFAFIIDHHTYWNNTFRRLKIADNKITRNVAARGNSTIIVGAGNTVAIQHGNIFEDITIEGNTVNAGGGFVFDNQSALIGMQGSEAANVSFERVSINNNQITGNNQTVGFAIDARRMHNSFIEGNIITGIGGGIALADDPVNTQVKNNTVGDSVLAYHFSWSGGNNRFETNYYIGTPITVFEKLRVLASDILQDPIKVSSLQTTPPAPPAPPLDTTAPTISNISASSITSGSAIISWNTDEASDTQVEYGLTTSYGLSSSLDSSQTLLHTATLPNLSPRTLYNYRVKSRDQAGNSAVSLNKTFVTLAATDTEAPYAIQNLSASNIQTNSFTLNWTAPADLPSGGAVSSYDIRYASFPINSLNFVSATQASGALPAPPGIAQSYVLTGLRHSTVYYVAMTSTDATGNSSTISNQVIAVTLSPRIDSRKKPKSKIYVGGLPYATTDAQLQEIFSAHGTVESARVITDKFTGRSRGFGFVEMSSTEEAQRAIQALNGTDLDGRSLTVNEAGLQERQSGSRGDRGSERRGGGGSNRW